MPNAVSAGVFELIRKWADEIDHWQGFLHLFVVVDREFQREFFAMQRSELERDARLKREEKRERLSEYVLKLISQKCS